MKRLIPILIILWASSYSYYRATSSEVWPQDRQTYVTYPATPMGQALYYLWWPLSYADKALTGRGARVGSPRPGQAAAIATPCAQEQLA